MRHLLVLGIFSCKKTEKKDSYYYLDYGTYSATTGLIPNAIANKKKA